MPNWVTNKVEIRAHNQEELQQVLKAIQRDGDVLGSFDFNKLIPMPESLDVTDGSITDEAISAITSHLSRLLSANPSDPNLADDFRKYYLAAIRIKNSSYFHPGYQHLSQKEIYQLAEKNNMTSEDLIALGKKYLDNQINYGAHTWHKWRNQNWGTKWELSEGSVFDEENTLSFDTAWSAPEPILIALSEKFPTIEFSHRWADEDLGQNVGHQVYLNGDITYMDLPEPGSAQAYEMAFDVMDTTPQEQWLRFDSHTQTYEYDESLETALYNRSKEETHSVSDMINTASERSDQSQSKPADMPQKDPER